MIKRAQEKQQNNAATTIQSAVRNRNALNETISRAKKKQINETLNNAMENIKKQDAASTIQKVVRGHKARKETAPAIIEEVLTNRKMKEIKQNVKAAQISKQTLDDAMKELIKEDTASTKLSSAFKGHKGRKEYNYIKNYPQQALKRQLEVSNTQPSTNLQNLPRTSYLRNVNTKKKY
jgi:hypothetical protein